MCACVCVDKSPVRVGVVSVGMRHGSEANVAVPQLIMPLATERVVCVADLGDWGLR